MISLNHMSTFMCCDIFKNLRRCTNQAPTIRNMSFAISRDTTAPTAFRIPHRNFSDPFIQLRRIMMAGRFQFSPRFPNKKASHPTGETLKIRTRDDDFTANPFPAGNTVLGTKSLYPERKAAAAAGPQVEHQSNRVAAEQIHAP